MAVMPHARNHAHETGTSDCRGSVCAVCVPSPYFYYAFNFCADVSIDDVKDVSPGCEGLQGAAVQWLAEGFDDCNIVGTYDPNEDEKIWSLYDEDDPSKGVTLSYIGSPTNKCGPDKSTTRTLTLDVVCADKAGPAVQFAQHADMGVFKPILRPSPANIELLRVQPRDSKSPMALA